jgi:predicted lipid-binding transport protein (Tim44 family)
MSFFHRFKAAIALLALTLGLTLVAADYAEARRGGSFGSRGTRTWQAPPVTNTAPRQVQPVERTMAPRPSANETGSLRSPSTNPRPGFFNGFGRSLVGGLLLGGLIGMLMGTGFGGAAGLLGLVLQIGLLVLGAMLLMRFLRNRQQPAYAGAPVQRSAAGDSFRVPDVGRGGGDRGDYNPAGGDYIGRKGDYMSPPAATSSVDDVGLQARDFDDFERLLGEVQDAYAREDFGALRELTTPEVMGYLSEELGQNATRGVRNEVSATKLLQGDLAEAWREGDADYATLAMRYESIDVTRDRASGRIVEGDPDRPTEATELWTFVRRRGAPWKLSAIQEA